MTDVVDNNAGGGQYRNQLRGTIEKDASESSDLAKSSDLNTILSSGEDRASGTPTWKLRSVHHPSLSTRTTPYQSPYLPQPASKKLSRATKEVDMPYQDVDLTTEANQATADISWHEPHPIFVILLIGPDEVPFGIQKNLLCAQSPFYRHEFAKVRDEKVEHLVKLPNTEVTTFGCLQNFLYTGDIYDKRSGMMVPDYPVLMGVWKLATQLKMAPLRVAVLDAMVERRQQTGFIPNIDLLVEAWRQTEEGSGLRKMLIDWVAEHLRTSPHERSAFAKSLPQQILSALVIVLSDIPFKPVGPTYPATAPHSPAKRALSINPEDMDIEQSRPTDKRARKSAVDLVNSTPEDLIEVKRISKKPARKSESGRRPLGRRVSAPATAGNNDSSFTPEKEMEYCRDLIKRMISGPGYWTRYVPNFKKPVDPVIDNAPNYFDVVKKPMCLNLMKTKMDKGDYTSGAQFEADIRLIFQNCYEYWTPDEPIWKECEAFEDFFNTQWAQRSKYSGHGKRVKAEMVD